MWRMQHFFYSRTDYNSSVYYENSSFSGGKVYGIDTNYLNTCGYQVRSGRGFVQADYDNFRKVALVDSYAADTMFPGANPVGKIIEIGSDADLVIFDPAAKWTVENDKLFYLEKWTPLEAVRSQVA